MSFENSSHFTIQGKNTFNHVHGDQYNIEFNSQIATERTEYDEFEYIKRGHVISLKEIHTMDVTRFKWKEGSWYMRDVYRSKTYNIQLFGQQSRFTALLYEGEDARRAWEEDFQRHSRTRLLPLCLSIVYSLPIFNRDPGSCQLFGINRSEIPMLIFHHDLTPLTQFYKNSFWKDSYASCLMRQLKCSSSQIWMDTNRGVFCSGPDVPDVIPLCGAGVSGIELTEITVPATVDMFDDNIIFNFFRRFNYRALHRWLVESAYRHVLDEVEIQLHPGNRTPEDVEDEQCDLEASFPGMPYQQVIDAMPGLHLDTVYSTSLDAMARWPHKIESLWEWCSYSSMTQGVTDRKLVESGLTRFTLNPSNAHQVKVVACFDLEEGIGRSWLSQFSRHIEDLGSENYFVIRPRRLTLQSTGDQYSSNSSAGCDSEISQIRPPIYLFLYPLTFATAAEIISWIDGHTHSHFWSLDEDGRSEMTEDELERWDVPKLAPHSDIRVWLRAWPDYIYTALRDWQIAQGFTPTTADFARDIGLVELENLKATRPLLEVTEEAEDQKASSWWEAIAGSGISACAF